MMVIQIRTLKCILNQTHLKHGQGVVCYRAHARVSRFGLSFILWISNAQGKMKRTVDICIGAIKVLVEHRFELSGVHPTQK